ncbi:PSP1 domain-containing protein [Sebaldella sp. S0638]|uniref:PSP1 family protein n=1 Tax=Sebaldella sp. S0638 TaxID=2957809 RepID=UPI0020A03BA8|nr:PSP1 domain-containing protein [Sebaldella sp. S0638]MCP1225223.1 PSP1 domain-containing protein [Sebaldella sp. S0638]
MKLINVKFRKTKKVYLFKIDDSNDYRKGDTVIVETARGDQIGIIINDDDNVIESDDDELKVRGIKRKLTNEEIAKLEILDQRADEAYFVCKKIVKEILPEMNLVIGEYTFDESKLIFYFTAEGRLDFRELVKAVNKEFKKRVEFYQIKPSDEGRILSAFGKYGKELYW